MVKLMNRYYIDNEDLEICVNSEITLSEYLRVNFLSDVAEVDLEFAKNIRKEDFRIAQAEKFEHDDPAIEEWHIWLVQQDEAECKALIEKLLGFSPSGTDFVTVREQSIKEQAANHLAFCKNQE